VDPQELLPLVADIREIQHLREDCHGADMASIGVRDWKDQTHITETTRLSSGRCRTYSVASDARRSTSWPQFCLGQRS
jgi:hypothetical protein